LNTNNKYKILLVEDEATIRNLITTILKTENYQVISAETCELGQMLFNSYKPDLVILDLGLPDMDGNNFIEYVRTESLTPIIVLSARTDEKDKVLSLDAGANDYITKPFGAAELLARIRSILRNFRHSAESSKLSGGKFVIDDLVINYDSRQVFLADKEIKFTQTEYNIIALLSEHCGKMLTYTTICNEIWGRNCEGCTKKLQVNMANIRKKLGIKPGESHYIINELGVGYRMSNGATK